MGQDKGLVPFLGVPLVQRVLDRLRGTADGVTVVTNRPADYAFLGVPLVEDLLIGRGALGGLYTALTAAHNLGAEIAGVIACDLPFANPRLLAAACDLLLTTHSDAVIPRTSQGSEPYHAVYRPASCLPQVRAALEAEKWRVDSWFPEAQVRFMLPEEWAPFDPHGLAFWNVNTPCELREAEDKARELGEI